MTDNRAPRTDQQTMPMTLVVAGESASAAEEASVSIWKLVNDRLRGRWRPMIIIGVVLGFGMAAAGYLSTFPIYKSTGTIRVAPRLPVTLAEIPETGQLDHFSAFMATQEQLIRSRRVLENAMRDEKFLELPWSADPAAIAILEEALEAKSDRHSELISVSFSAGHPAEAQTVVNAVIRSYYDIYAASGGDEIGATLQRLHDLHAELRRDLQSNRAESKRIIAQYGTTDLAELQSIKLNQIFTLEQHIGDAQITLLQLGVDGDTNPTTASAPTMQLLEQFDSNLLIRREQREQAEQRFAMIRARFRPATSQYRRAHRDLEVAQRLYEEQYLAAVEEWQITDGIDPTSGLALLNPQRVRDRIDSFAAQADALREESRELSQALQRLDEVQFEEERIRGDIDQALTRIQQLELEESSVRSGRINVAQWGYHPPLPDSDGRRKRAAAGGMFGFMVSFGLFFLWGTVDRRAFGAAQLSSGAAADVPCLGVLPDLTRTSRDPESSDVAAHCVHQIRNQIEIHRSHRDRYAIAVTSPHQGDGKTSIVMALGWSYAASGHNTLLIDCDMVGRSLSRQLGLAERPGLKEAILSGNGDDSVMSLGVPLLSALPVGNDMRLGAEALRGSDLRTLLDSIAGDFDVIIIDTGPMLGSLESTPVVSVADGVVLSLRRGRSRSRLEDCLKRLESVGTSCLGMILNCAGRSECYRYVSEASLAAAEHVRDRSAAASDTGSVVRVESNESSALMRAMEAASPLPRVEHAKNNAA